MATIQASVSGAVTATSTNNRTGRFKGAATSTIVSGLMKGIIAGRDGTITGNRLVDNTWMDKALSSGTFAYLRAGYYIIKRVTTSISGVTSNVMKFGGQRSRRSINFTESNRVTRTATAIVAGYYKITTGTFSTPPTSANDSFGTDDAARPSRAVPGELTFKYGRPLPFDEEYSVKVNG